MEDEHLFKEYLQDTLGLVEINACSHEELITRLSAFINRLIDQDFQKLIALLYTIDVNEKKLRILLNEYPGTDAGKLIAGLIIDRQLQKIATRKQFRQDQEDCNEEKW